METLLSFLNSKLIYDSDYSFVSMKKGKFRIRGEDLETYFKLYINASPEFTKENSPSMAWRKPDDTQVPLTFDLDFLHLKEFDFTETHIEELSHLLCNGLVSFDDKINPFAICITRKEHPYIKIKEDITYWKQGIHVYVIYVLVEQHTSKQLYRHLKQQLHPFCKKHDFCEKYDTLDSDCCPWGKNGILMLADFKPLCNDRYHICYTAAFDKKIIKEYHYPQADWHQTMKKHFKNIYAFLYHPRRTGDWSVISRDIVDPPKTAITFPLVPSQFNLHQFLEKTKTHNPNWKEYCQIITYLCSIRHSREEVISLCNEYWNTSENFNPEETSQFYDTHIETSESSEDERYVTRGTIKRYVSMYKTDLYFQANGLWDNSIVQMSTHYNDYIVFTQKRPFERYQLQQFIMDSICYISSSQIFAYTMYVERKDKHGNLIRVVNTNLSKKAPFTQSDDFQVLVLPDRDTLNKKLKSHGKRFLKQHDNCIALMKKTKLSLVEFRAQCLKLLGNEYPEPALTKMSSIVYEVQLRADIPRFTTIVFEPYCGKQKPTSTLDSYNTYQENFYESYTPTRTVYIEDTVIYTFLFEVYNHENPDKLQLAYLMNFIAWKLQYPARRSERLWQICSASQGSGKSSLYRLLVLIFSKDLCAFHVTLDTLVCRFNNDTNSKLFQWCDDVQSATRAQTRALFPLVTTPTTKYEQKGEKRIEMNEFSEIILTSNDTSPTYMSYQDRRQVVLGISSCWKDKEPEERRRAFDSLYQEFDDFDIGYAWYQFLKQRDVSKWHPSMNPPLDFTSASQLECMPSYHRFAAEFFVEPGWFDYNRQGRFYTDNILLEREENRFVYYISKKTIVEMFFAWVYDERKSETKLKRSTLLIKFEECGFQNLTRRKRIHKIQRSVLRFTESDVQAALRRMYPTLQLENWLCEEDPEQFVKDLSDKHTGFISGYDPCT